jgi:hypothetical protein
LPKQPNSELELSILRTLISHAETGDFVEASEISQIIKELTNYGWSDQEHRVVFGCLRVCRGQRAVRLREEMAAQATRMGHPDVAWDLYFGYEAEKIDLTAMIRL